MTALTDEALMCLAVLQPPWIHSDNEGGGGS